MGAIAEAKKALERLGAARAAQQAEVDALQAPLKRLRELQEAERATAEALAQAEAERAHLEAVLFDNTRFLKRWEPQLDRLATARDVLELLEDAGSEGADMSQMSVYDVNRAKLGILAQIEYITNRQAERATITKRLKELA